MSIQPASSGLSAWLSTPLGAHLLAAELRYFDQELADVFGFNAFQLGLPEFDFLRANRMPYRWVTGMNGPVRLQSDLCALPIQSSVADLVVLPHALEFSNNPHQVLREVSRILMPEGHVVLSGFNPWSLWGVRRLANRREGVHPWCGQFINLPRIKDWMALLGFELAGGRMCCYAPPVATEKWFRRFDFMEEAGDRWWPFAGGIYFLHGIKRVQGMRIITPKWKSAEVKKKALAAVPHKTNGHDDALAARTNHMAGDPQ
ncbi:MAG TPA: methyltransferase domain-containing protein [Burkholderiales bacterium]|jgi:SAM-dependent methyltransferase|nr:methyltransferase domain-containing protein [Burkholderiales bacterium]